MNDFTEQTSAEKLRAQMAALRQIYMAQLPEKIEAMQELWRTLCDASPQIADAENQAWQDLHRAAHSLAGSGATYGFPEISRAARALEIRVNDTMVRGVTDAAICALIQQDLAQLRVAMQSGSNEEFRDTPEDEARPGEADSNEFVAPAVDSTQLGALADSVANPAKAVRAQDASRSDSAAASDTVWPDSARRLVYLSGNINETRDLQSQIGHFGYEVQPFNSTSELQSAVALRLPSAIIADVSSLGGLDALRAVLTLSDTEDEHPQLLFVSEHGDMESRLQAVRAGGDAYFTKPLDASELIDKLDALTAHEEPSPYRILIVDDEAALASFYSLTLQGAGMTTAEVNDPMQVMQTLADFRPDLILMDVYMPHCTGLELATVIRQQEDYVSIPIVFLSAETDLQKQMAAMSSGGDDFLVKPIQPEHLVSSVATRALRSRTLRSFMIRDSLTGLLNHTTTKEQLEIEILRARRGGGVLSFAMIDIDRFKSVNDSYGHLIGDRVIKSMARILGQRLRKTDIIGRYGGEEFAAILPGTDGETAVRVLEQIRRGFGEIRHHSPKGDFSVTFSCGVAEYPYRADAATLNDSADKALYEAKRSGRNRVVFAK